jgi:hypothetical protein
MTEVLIPPLDEEGLVLKGQLSNASDLGAIEAAREDEIHGLQPELGHAVACAYMDMRRLLPLVAEGMEAEPFDHQ